MSSDHRASHAAAPADIVSRPVQIPVLDRLPAGPRERLSARFSRRDLGAGETFMREGETTRFLAIVVRGRVAVRMRVPERGSITVLTLDVGDIIGWSAVVPPYRAATSCTTLEPTDLATIDAAELREMLASDAEVAAALLPSILETVAVRLGATRDQLLDLFRGTGMDPW